MLRVSWVLGICICLWELQHEMKRRHKVQGQPVRGYGETVCPDMHVPARIAIHHNVFCAQDDRFGEDCLCDRGRVPWSDALDTFHGMWWEHQSLVLDPACFTEGQELSVVGNIELWHELALTTLVDWWDASVWDDHGSVPQLVSIHIAIIEAT